MKCWHFYGTKILFLTSLFFILAGSSIKAEDLSASLGEAQVAYDQNDFDRTVQLCEQILSKHPENIAAKKLLQESLLIGAEEKYLMGHADQSYDWLNKAISLFPNAEEANTLYQKIRSREAAEIGISQSNGQAALPQDFSAFLKVVEKSITAQKEAITQTTESLKKIAESGTEEKKNIIEAMNKREELLNKEINYTRKYSLLLVLVGAVILIGLVVLLIWVLEKIAQRREQILFRQSEEFLHALHEESGKALEHFTEAVKALPMHPMNPASAFAALPDETNAKLRRIDIIDAEIIQEGKEPSQTDENILKSLLKDPNPEIRMRTIQVLLKYDIEEAYRQIEGMTLSGQKEQRLSAIKLLGGIATDRSARILISCLEDEEGELRRQAMGALRSILKENLDTPTEEMIHNALAGISQNEGWIVH